MNFVADEGIDRAVVVSLRSQGHDVYYIAESSSGIRDEEVLSIALKRDALLITADKDFGELVFRRGQATSGVILIRLSGISRAEKTRIVMRAIEQHGNEMRKNFTSINPRLVRIRGGS